MNKEVDKLYDRGIDWIVFYGPKILASLVVLIAGFWVIRIIKRKVRRHMGKSKINNSLRPFFESLIFTSLQVALIFLVMQILGIQLTVFAAVIAAFGAAVGLALSGTLQNFASGILILLLKPFNAGDNIITQGFEGTVTSIQIFYTIVTTFDKRIVIVPNSKLSNEIIVNVTRSGSRRLDVELKFAYKNDPEKVRKILYDTITGSSDVLKEPVPRIGVSTFVDDGYKMIANIWLNAHGFEDVKLIINERIAQAINESGFA